MPTSRIFFLKSSEKKTSIYKKEKLEYIQGQASKTKNSVEDRQSRMACQTVNEVSRKSTSRGKLKLAGQEESNHRWKEHFKNQLGKPPEITVKTILKNY